MMKQTLFLTRYCALAVAMLLAAFAATATNLAERADSAYSAEDYPAAVELYRQSIAADGPSSLIWYNLGNAHYRAGNLSQAILAYERALRYDPTNDDARTNLEFVNGKIVDVPADTDSYSTLFVEKSMHMMTSDGWAITALGMFVLTLCLVGGYILSGNVVVRKICFFAGIAVLAFTIVSIVLALEVKHRMTARDRAIVTAVSSQLSTSPSTPTGTSQQAFMLHEGTKVQVLDSVATPMDSRTKLWYEVSLDDEHRAWIPATDVEII